MNNFYIKMSPLTGMVGYGGGGTGLTFNSGAAKLWYGDRGVAYGNNQADKLDYITISTAANANDFGQFGTTQRESAAGVSNGDRGCWGGGASSGDVKQNIIDYIIFATLSNTIDFGDLTRVCWYPAGASDGLRGVNAGGYDNSSNNIIDYFAIAVLGNATDFGDLIGTAMAQSAGLSDGTRAIIAGGSGPNDNIQYYTIQTTGNATDFGDLSLSRTVVAGCSNETRGCFGGGKDSSANNVNTIDYISIQSPGNASDFGDLTIARRGTGSTSNNSRGTWWCGYSGVTADRIDYVDISSTGNATTFGVARASRSQASASSGDA